jgi:hypothetical protein
MTWRGEHGPGLTELRSALAPLPSPRAVGAGLVPIEPPRWALMANRALNVPLGLLLLAAGLVVPAWRSRSSRRRSRARPRGRS